MQTPRLSLPLVAAGQAQKHVTVNEALLALDRYVQASAISRSLTMPPSDAAEGAMFIVPANASGAWTAQTQKLAVLESTSWRFVTPAPGFAIWVADEDLAVRWDGATWQVTGQRLQRLGLGVEADATNVLALAGQASLFNHAGAGHQLKLNRATGADTGTVLFQTAHEGRAEIGLAGTNDFSLKVSPDGDTWITAMAVNTSTGAVALPATPGMQLRQLLVSSRATPLSTTSTTPVATGLEATVTPATTPATIRLSGHVTVGANYWYTAPQISIWRNNMQIWPADGYFEHQLLADTPSNSLSVSATYPFNVVENLASVGPVTYSVRLSTRVSGFNAHLNRRDLDTSFRGDSCLIVEEWA